MPKNTKYRNSEKLIYFQFVMSVGKILTSFGPRYDDGQWHALSVTHTKESLTLTVDDFDTFR